MKSFRPLIKQACRLLLPPVVLKIARLVWRGQPGYEYFPHVWDEFHPAPSMDEEGRNAESLVTFEKERWQQFRRNLEGTGPLGFSHEHHDLAVVDNPWFHNIHLTFAYTLALTAHCKKSVAVLDFGGGIGHYYLIAKAVLPEVHFDYHIEEVPRMIEAGRILNPKIIWHADDGRRDQAYDLVVISGSLQYLRNWEEKLRQLCRAAKGHLFLTRLTTVLRSPSFLVIQRRFNSEWLNWILNCDAVLAVVRDSGFELLREFVVGDHFFVSGSPEECVLRGWLFQRSPSSR